VGASHSSQSTTGELRLTITGPNGLGVKSTVEIVSQGNQYRNTFATDEQGVLDAKRLPYGIYQLQIRAQGFAQDSSRSTSGPRFHSIAQSGSNWARYRSR